MVWPFVNAAVLVLAALFTCNIQVKGVFWKALPPVLFVLLTVRSGFARIVTVSAQALLVSSPSAKRCNGSTEQPAAEGLINKPVAVVMVTGKDTLKDAPGDNTTALPAVQDKMPVAIEQVIVPVGAIEPFVFVTTP